MANHEVELEAAQDGVGSAISTSQFNPAVHDGKLTLVSPRTGDHRTFRLRTIRSGDLAGKRVVELLEGPDNGGDYRAFGFVGENRITVWKRFRGAGGELSQYEKLAGLIENPIYWASRGVEYLISLKCRRCGHDLTHPESITDGLGPICRRKAAGG